MFNLSQIKVYKSRTKSSNYRYLVINHFSFYLKYFSICLPLGTSENQLHGKIP